MNKYKICMVGDFAVGKTSLTQKFVNNVFSEKYLTTVGVKIDTASVGEDKIVVWDIAGRDSLAPINLSYLLGARGIVFVADLTRPDTHPAVLKAWELVEEKAPQAVCAVALNKMDLQHEVVDSSIMQQWQDRGWSIVQTSAKSGWGVDELFTSLVEKISAKA